MAMLVVSGFSYLSFPTLIFAQPAAVMPHEGDPSPPLLQSSSGWGGTELAYLMTGLVAGVLLSLVMFFLWRRRYSKLNIAFSGSRDRGADNGGIVDLGAEQSAFMQRLQVFFDQSQLALAIFEREKRNVLYVNDQFVMALKADRDRIPKSAGGFFAEEQQLQELCARVEDGELVEDFEVWLKTAEGRDVFVLLCAMPFFYEDRQAVMVWLYDTGFRKGLEKELIAARHRAELAAASKSDFLATMSHEIRTPLNGINGLLELLWMSDLNKEQKDMLETVMGSAETLMVIIDDILDFSKIEAGKMRLEKVPFCLHALLQGVLKTIEANAAAKSLILELDYDETISPAVIGDPVRLRQVLFNILSNAIKFTSQGGIYITVANRGLGEGQQSFSIEVRDTGIGIPEDQMDRLFQPFMQAEASTTRRYGGSGLGLAITSKLVSIMHGKIRIDSTFKQGTAVTLDFSMETVPEENQNKILKKFKDGSSRFRSGWVKDYTRRRDHAIGAGKSILLVEDHAVNRYAIGKQLNQLGYAAEMVEDGLKALDAIREKHFDLVMTDCHMPAMDGYDLAQHIRAEEARLGKKPVPIMAITANAMEEAEEECLKAGMNDYLSKPVALQTLAEKLAFWLEGGATSASVGVETDVLTSAFPDSPLDLSVIREVVGDNIQAAQEMFIAYLEANTEDVDILQKVAADKDIKRLSEVAHSMKGAALMIGAGDLAQRALTLEKIDENSDWPDVVEPALKAFLLEMKSIRSYLEKVSGVDEAAKSRTG